ncbi:MAG: hypothetical protein EHM24_17230 [Acidobacteria bacterium]|nr:MAG: hypothetical protein EHM24_17230 [Acidobacteriota bacterium]
MQLKKTVAAALLSLALVFAGLSAYAQMQRPYRDGSVWNVAFIKMKPGMESAYLNYLANDWKREQEALKKEGLILSYKVLATEAHGTTDWNMLLMTEYKDLATMEANQQKMDQVGQQLFGSDEKIRQGYKDRLEIREVMGERIAREIVLEPRTKSKP